MLSKMDDKELIGIVLAGGLGTRMGRKTKGGYRVGTNKHLIQIYDRPMIDYPITTLVDAGIKNIIIVTGPEYAEDFSVVLHYWEEERGVNLCYILQKEPKGIAHALGLTRFVVAGRKSVVILGDNYFGDRIEKAIEKFKESDNAHIFLKSLPNKLLYEIKDNVRRARFGIATIKKDKITEIEEKPTKPKSNYAITGLYFYPADVFDKIKRLKPSWRNELEISDVNNMYIAENRLNYFLLKKFWSDMGNPESVYRTANFIRKKLSQNSKNL